MSMENPKDDTRKSNMSRKLESGDKTCLSRLESVLRKGGKWIILSDLDVSPGCPPGENFVADVLRIVAYGKKLSFGAWRDFHKNFIIKKIPDQNSFRYKFHDCHRLFENEITAYEVVLPLCQSYIEKKSRDKINELCFPRYYGQCQEFLVLEDLQTKGYQMVNRIKGFTKRECSLILQELSKFHAVSFALKKNEMASFSKMTNFLNETIIREEHTTDVMGVIWENSLSFAIRSLTESGDVTLANTSEKLKLYSGKVIAILCDLIKSNSSKFSVICHGDLWNNNILLRYCDSGYPIGVKFIDLQVLRYGSCVLDVMHVLFTSSRPSVHQNHLNILLAEYYESLESNLKNLGESVDFTFDEFNAEFRSKILFGVLFACLMYTCITKTSEPQESDADVSEETFSGELQIEKMYIALNSGYHERVRSLFTTLTSHKFI